MRATDMRSIERVEIEQVGSERVEIEQIERSAEPRR